MWACEKFRGGVTVAATGWKSFVDGETKDQAVLCRPSAADGEYVTKATGLHFQLGPLWEKIYPTCMLTRVPHIRFAPGCSLGEDSAFLIQFLRLADRIVVNGNSSPYYYRLRRKSLCHGHDKLMNATNYWRATHFLQCGLQGSNLDILREWIVHAIYGHMASLSFKDLKSLLLRMTTDGVDAWKSVFIEETPDDRLYRNWKHPYAKIYARIILSRQPLTLKTLEMLCVDYFRRGMNRIFA